MGPKHKGFPMTQSIHFDQERKKRFLGLTPIRGPLWTVIIPFDWKPKLGLILQAEGQKLYMYKNGWGLHLKGCPWVLVFEIWWWNQKKT